MPRQKEVPEAVAGKRRQRQSSPEETATRPSTWPRDGYIREQRPDAALDVLGAVCTSTERSNGVTEQQK